MDKKKKQKEPREYYDKFPTKKKRKRALEYALDIRKFEIDLYWKRASYFWVLIGAAFVGYTAVFTQNDIAHKNEISLFLACLGLVFSCAWYSVNRGSKFWQENWENHVDMLEDEFMGKLYKTVLRTHEDKRFWKLSSASPISVSKTNLLVSLYVVFLWFALLAYSVSEYFSPTWSAMFVGFVLIVSLVTCAFLIWGNKSSAVSVGNSGVINIRKNLFNKN